MFDLFLVLECVDACTSVDSDVSDWSHGFVEMTSHTQKVGLCKCSGREQHGQHSCHLPDILSKNVQDLL